MKPKNLIILMSDEHTRSVTGCYGHPFVSTPNIDKLAAGGVTLASGEHIAARCVIDCRDFTPSAQLPTWLLRICHRRGYNPSPISRQAFDGRRIAAARAGAHQSSAQAQRPDESGRGPAVAARHFTMRCTYGIYMHLLMPRVSTRRFNDTSLSLPGLSPCGACRCPACIVFPGTRKPPAPPAAEGQVDSQK